MVETRDRQANLDLKAADDATDKRIEISVSTSIFPTRDCGPDQALARVPSMRSLSAAKSL